MYICSSEFLIFFVMEIGDLMPEFEVLNQDGVLVRSKDFLGRKTVIYCYPKDNTPGCTAEACDIRDNFERFLAEGYRVVGVSKDSAESHRKFREKYGLPFDLLADTDTSVLQALGAWGEKKMYGKVSVGTLRKTFVFDEKGVLVRVIGKVDTKNHSAQIL